MPALSGQLIKQPSPWGTGGLKKMTPKENLQNVRAMMTQWGSDAINKMSSSGQTSATNGEQAPAGNSTNAPTATANGASVSSSNKQNLSSVPAKASSTAAAASATPVAQQTPPLGILPGTPAYSEWLKNNPVQTKTLPPEQVDPSGTTDGGATTPPSSGIVIKGSSGGKRRLASSDITIPEEMLAGITPEMRADIERVAASGDFGPVLMKYWGDPKISEISNYVRKNRAMGRPMVQKRGSASFGDKGATGIRWMDQRYNDNMAKWQAEEDARNAPPTPASGNGQWVQGRQGPIWQPGPAGPGLDPYGNPEETMYAGGSPGWDNGGGMAPPNFQYPPQQLPPYLQQYLMMQQQMSQGQYPGAY